MTARTRRPAALLSLLLALPAAPALAWTGPGEAPPPGPDLSAPAERPAETTVRLALGVASFAFTDLSGRRRVQQGAALELRLSQRTSDLFSVDAALTWGLTDWERARAWTDAGNEAGRWTTGRIRAVGDWATEREDQRGARLLPAAFADLFLALTYLAVPVCYAGSVGGATSHLQLDVTGALHAGVAPLDAWLEGGLGVLALPTLFRDWDFGVGPVAGLGARLGPVRFGVRLLWSPPALHGGDRVRGTLFTSAATISVGR